MDKRKKLKCSALVVLSCSIVPMTISGGYGYMPAVSDKIVYSAAKELSVNTELEAKSASAQFPVVRVSVGARDLMAAPEEIESRLPEGTEIPTPLPSQEVLDAL
ncbi:MAG: hypothetical protein IJ740_08015, partial [Ruminococcus sp.]|nr:hypothetical protein [Ruminococcus sp.]